MAPGERARCGFSEEQPGIGQSPGAEGRSYNGARAFAWPDIAGAPGHLRSEERRRPGYLRQGDPTGVEPRSSTREENDLTARDALASGPGKRLPSPRRGKTTTGPLSDQRNRGQRVCRSRSGGVVHRADKAQKQGAKPPLLHCAPRPLAPAPVSEETRAGLGERLPGPPRGPARLPRKACRNRQQHLERGRCRIPRGSLPKKQPLGRRQGLEPGARQPTGSPPEGEKEEGSAGPGRRESRRSRRRAWFPRKPGRCPTITETRRGDEPAVPGPATPPEGGEARYA